MTRLRPALPDERVSADILYRFATPEAVKAPTKKAWNALTIKGLTDALDNRGVRVRDCVVCFTDGAGGTFTPIAR